MSVKGKTFDGPLDAVEDFDNPTTVPGSPADTELGQSEEDPQTDGAEEEARNFSNVVSMPASEQQTLPGTEVTPDVPQFVRNKQMLADFVEALIVRDKKNDTKLLKFKFSFMLTPDHEEHLPPEVVDAWNVVKQGHCKRYDIIEMMPQTITVNLVPDDESTPTDLKIVNAVIERPSLQLIEESGSGKVKTGIRFSFIAVTDRDDEPTEFALAHDGDGVWISMARTQGSLIE